MTTAQLIEFEGGDITASLDDRTITGLLIPFNEIGATNVGRFMVEAAGIITLPADPSIVGLNTDHERSAPVGRATKVWESAQGIMATFTIAATPEGDAALADAISPTGKRRRLSGEFHAAIKAGKATAGRLWGAALVELGAFPSAAVLAADTPDDLELPDALEPDADGHAAVIVTALPVDITATTPEGETATYTPEANPAPANPEGESTVTASAPVAAAPVAPTSPINPALNPGAPVLASAPAIAVPRAVEAQTVFASIAALRANPSDHEAQTVLAALSDIKFDGSGALPAAGVIQPNWLGSIYDGVEYQREYIDLATHGTNITAGGKKGFKPRRGTVGAPIAGPAGIPNGGNWAGNKTEINSYAGFTETAASILRRFAVGEDVAREFYDLPGGAEVIEGFLRLQVEDYLYWSDMWALDDIQTAAGAPIAAGTYPTDYPAVVGMLIQGILAVKARKANGRRDVPTYAIANDEAYAALAYAAGGAEHLPAFVSLAISTNSNGTVDGNVQIVQGDTGITGSASVIVGAKRAIEFDELAGGPLIINALEIARGGIDRAVHGYLQTFTVRPEAVVLIGTSPAFAQSTAYQYGDLVKYTTTQYRVVVAGTTAAANPTAPAVGSTVVSGSATLLRIA